MKTEEEQRVVIAVMASGDGKYLVIRRPDSSAGGGLLGFCGGKIDPGESEERAIEREVLEELGAKVVATFRVGEWPVEEWGCIISAWHVDGSFDALAPSTAEVAEVLWLTGEEIRQRTDVLRSTLLVLDALG